MTAVLGAPGPVPAAPGPVLGAGAGRRCVTLSGVAVLAACTASLPSLLASVDDLRYGAPLAELGLLPYAALALLPVAALRHPWAGQLRAGRADAPVAGLALALAAAVLALGPVALDNLAYAVRVDLLAVPLVATAALVLLLGVRALVAFAVPLSALALSWPLPWRALLTPAAGAVEGATRAALEAVLAAAPWLAAPVGGPGDLRLVVDGPGDPFEVVVAAPCSGTTGMTAVLLAGLLLQYVLHGRPRARAVWLVTAVSAAFLANLVRLLLLLAAGRAGGERLALDVVHPLAGLVLLNLVVVVLLAGSARFGLHLALHPPVRAGTPLTAPAPRTDRMPLRTLGRRTTGLLVACLLLGWLDSGVGSARHAYAGPLPAATSFAAAPYGTSHAVTGAVEQQWSRRYFGPDSRWTRYRLRPAEGTAPFSLWLDALRTSSWSPLRAHPVLECYRFHGYELVSVRRPVLPSGLLADEVVYRDGDGATWHVLSWTWAVRDDGDLGFERVTLLASSTRKDLPRRATGSPVGPRARVASVWGAATSGTDPAPALTAGLHGVAAEVIAGHVQRDAR